MLAVRVLGVLSCCGWPAVLHQWFCFPFPFRVSVVCGSVLCALSPAAGGGPVSVDPDLLPNWDHPVLVRCADCLWWGISEKGYMCDLDKVIVTRAAARSRDHPCPWFISRGDHLAALRDRVRAEVSKPLDDSR
jgi:hypothetical protein